LPECSVITERAPNASVKPERKASAASLFRLYPAATEAPCEARLRQMAAPMPRVPPVTSATFPSSLSPANPVGRYAVTSLARCEFMDGGPSGDTDMALARAAVPRGRVPGPCARRRSVRAGQRALPCHRHKKRIFSRNILLVSNCACRLRARTRIRIRLCGGQPTRPCGSAAGWPAGKKIPMRSVIMLSGFAWLGGCAHGLHVVRSLGWAAGCL